MDTKNDGLENVYAFKYGNVWYLCKFSGVYEYGTGKYCNHTSATHRILWLSKFMKKPLVKNSLLQNYNWSKSAEQ